MHSLRLVLQRQASRVVSQRFLQTTSTANMPAKVGDKLPSADMFQNTPGDKVNVASMSGKVVVVGVPGAFTPTCHKDHVPSVLQNFDALKAKGVEKVVVMSVNDPFVMAAWGESLKGEGKAMFLADTCGEFTQGLDLSLDAAGLLGNKRCKRFALVAENGVIKSISVEPDGVGLSCSRGTDILGML